MASRRCDSNKHSHEYPRAQRAPRNTQWLPADAIQILTRISTRSASASKYAMASCPCDSDTHTNTQTLSERLKIRIGFLPMRFRYFHEYPRASAPRNTQWLPGHAILHMAPRRSRTARPLVQLDDRHGPGPVVNHERVQSQIIECSPGLHSSLISR